MNKVGIMGGTFNPVHNGHLFLAEHAYEQVGLDYVLFMPTMNPPHKTRTDIISAEHRLNMVKLAIKNNPNFKLSDLELKRPGLTYTSDTLKILKENEPDNELYFIVGADSLMMITTWHEPQTIFSLSTLVVGERKDYPAEKLKEQADYLEKTYNGKIIFLDMPNIEISSENIRERIAENKTIRYYVPDDVLEYIKLNKLYT